MAPPPTAVAVRRRTPYLVPPAAPTPAELKPVSDIDDQGGNRFHISMLQFFPPSLAACGGRHPAEAIKRGVAAALVYYYPLAGRLREMPEGKLAVDCAGQGVLVVEAEADARLEEFGVPPVASAELAAVLLHVPEGAGGILGCPLLLVQVTKLQCGGFVLGLRFNHVLGDASGLAQFLISAGNLAQGATAPSILPVWKREIMYARIPPQVTYTHCEFDDVKVVDLKGALPPINQMQRRYIFFGPSEMSLIKMNLPPHLHRVSTFEIITACNWRCRTIALDLHPEQEVRATFTVSVRTKFSPPLMAEYYGNAFVMPTAVSTAGELCARPLEYALQLVKAAKSKVSLDYLHSVADLMVLRGRPHHSMVHTYYVSDIRWAKFGAVDFGWGKPVYDAQILANRSSFIVNGRNDNGEQGILVSVCLPPIHMERFQMELTNVAGRATKASHGRAFFTSLL